MHVHLLFLGSAGDFFPVFRIGLVLKERGHQVTIVGSGWARSFVEPAGLKFVEPIPEEILQSGMEYYDPGNLAMSIKHFLVPILNCIYEYVVDNYVPGETLFLSYYGYMGARCAAEKIGVPLINLFYSPNYVDDAMGYDPRILNEHMTEPLNRFREEIGLAPLTETCTTWMPSSFKNIALFPEWLPSSTEGWPTNIFYSGFPLPPMSRAPLSPEIESFLRDQSRPTLIFTPGTSLPNSHLFARVVVEACQRLNLRCLFVLQTQEAMPSLDPKTMLHVERVAFEGLFHRVDAIIHHGGIGTFSEALRAGKPQVIKPMYWDQFDNGKLARSMGVGETILPEDFNADVLTATLKRILSSTEMAAACRDYRNKVDHHDGILAAADFLEQIDLKALQLTPA